MFSHSILRTTCRRTLRPTDRLRALAQCRRAFETISSCPAPTCECAPMPAMPEGFEINQTNPLNHTMPTYAEQVLICTGKEDWVSDIAHENDGDNLAAELKDLAGRGGKYSNPYYKTLITNVSFPSKGVFLFPSFKHIAHVDRENAEDLVRGYLLPSESDPLAQWVKDKERLLRKETTLEAVDIKEVFVLICGHGGRDIRCGLLGPLLQKEFEKALENKTSPSKVGLISHISGHKFAGNVIIYIPPSLRVGGQKHPLAGCGIWYGRVEPRHVEGIVQETIQGGKLIKDLLRGAMTQNRESL